MAGQSDTVQQQDTLNRYLLYFPRSKNVSPDVHSFCGEEEFSKPYRYTIRFTSPNPNIAVKDVLNQMAEFILHAPNPKAKSTWHNQESWLPVRQINGVITSFSRLKSSADEALYECVLEHELALLDRNYRSAVYMDMTVPELVTKLMKESGHFQGYNIDFDQLSHNYPSREMIIQWKETDLQFIRRLLAEVGIWFRFENHDKVQGETVVILGDGGRRYVFSNKQLPYVRHSGMTSHEEYVTELEEQYQLIPENVLVRTYNYRDPFSPQADKTIAGNDIPHGITRGKQYHYADHFMAAGDFYGQEVETASFYARLRYERLLNKQSVLGVTTSDPELLPGVMFHPTGDIPDGFKPGFLVTTMTLSGSRAQHYRAILKGIPYLNGYSYRPEYLPRPVIAGTVPGRVAAINRDHTYAGVDAQGRYRVKFDFDLDEKRDGFESALMRLGRPYGGDVFGFHFPLLDGTEVAVAFEGGEMHLLSQKDFTMASTAGKMNGSAKEGMQFVCGGGGIRISPNGLVTLFSPTGIELKAPNLKYDGPESAQVTVPPFNKGAFKLRYQLHAGDDPEQILANKKFRLTSSAGKVVEGVTDSNGHSSLLDADDLDIYKMELME